MLRWPQAHEQLPEERLGGPGRPRGRADAQGRCSCPALGPSERFSQAGTSQGTRTCRGCAPLGRPAGQSDARDPAAAPVARELTGGLSLDPPKAPALRLPVDTSERPTERLPPAPAAGFSSAVLLDKLKTQPGSAAVTRSVWTEYRELILTGAIGMALLSAFIGYRAAGPEEPDPKLVLKSEIKPAPPSASPAISVSPSAAPPSAKASAAPVDVKSEPTTPSPSAAAAAEPEPTKAPTVAMLSVLSTPIGAEVLVNGEPAGVTPLIAKAPGNAGAIVHVRLMYPGYKPWDQTITANESGHYVANVTLEH